MTEAAPPRRGPLAWLWEGARTAVLLRPRWRGLSAGPALIVALLALGVAVGIGSDRLAVDGPATFWWRAVYASVPGAAVDLLLAWLFARAAEGAGDEAPRTGELFAMLCAQSLAMAVALALPSLAARFEAKAPEAWSELVPVAVGWAIVARVVLLARVAPARRGLRALAVAGVSAAHVFAAYGDPVSFWYAEEPQEAETPVLALTQEQMEAEPRLVAAQLDALAPQRAGLVDLYAITFAPYASQDVFMRESAMVAGVMAERFDARGRVVQLVNNAATLDTLAWATPLNLQRAIAAAARRMDRDEDVLFLHITSHGGADGELAMDFDPLALDPLTPQQLKGWLDEAGVRWRVISISACYSGSWIAPLAGDGTLVMTAADAEHTSFGCGSRSPLTFFGAAMYDEQLRRSTRSFEDAFAASRKLIDERERAAGKDDGYSNPQIAEGAGIRARLVKLQAQLAAREALGASGAK